MGNRKKYPPNSRNAVSKAVQAEALRNMFPASEVTIRHNSFLKWIGFLQPSELSDNYKVQILYRERPNVTVLSPGIQMRSGVNIPHVYPGDEICLYRPKYREWDSTMLLTKSIIPWMSLWLFHYEIWQATGIWSGSIQEHPPLSTTKKKD